MRIRNAVGLERLKGRSMPCRIALALLCAALPVTLFPNSAAAQPKPGIGLIIRGDELPAVREKISTAPWSEMYGRILKAADMAVVEWPKRRGQIAPLLPKVWDLAVGNNSEWPKEPDVRKAGSDLHEFASNNMCPAAFVYLLTGDEKYAAVAWEILEQMGRVNRWGWFPWDGTNMPQIHAGFLSRNAAFTLDFLWDYLTPAQRAQGREILAEKSVEPYFRLVLHSPAMGLHHLRSVNQGNNVLSGAFIACLALGDSPDADIWLRSFVQTFHWIVTHDIGWAGQHLESGMPGYWSVSMQNLYTAATCLANVKGIDLRGHPAFLEATFYPLYHESTVPPVGMFDKPIPRGWQGPAGVIAGKPIELPHAASCGPWWYDYAGRFPQSGARHFINKTMVRKDDQGRLSFLNHDCHQPGHSEILTLLWTKPELHDAQPMAPGDVFKTTDRMAMLRSGYGSGKTYLYFNGDLFLSALDEILCTTGGLSWHSTWHGWQKGESGIETEGEPLAPSMVIKKSAQGSSGEGNWSAIQAVSGPSNVAYYRPPGQDRCFEYYTRREREIRHVSAGRAANDAGYFVFLDRVSQPEPRRHSVLWQTWNHVHENKNENYGRIKREGENRVRIERPNADLVIQILAPAKVAFEVETAPGQPITSYMYDHNTTTLRVLAGGYGPVQGEAVEILPVAWKGTGEVVQGAEPGENAPASAYRIVGKDNLVGEKGAARNTFEVETALVAGQRCRMSIDFRKSDCNAYENLCWQIDLELLDGAGKRVAFDRDLRNPDDLRGFNLPGEFRLSDPRSMTKTTPWLKTGIVHFDVPPGSSVSRIRGQLRAAEWSHPPSGLTANSVLELGTLRIEPLGSVHRATEETFVALVIPVPKGETPAASIQSAAATYAALSQNSQWSLVPPSGSSVLAENSPASQELLRAGLEPLLKSLRAERDAPAAGSGKNLALSAKVTASGSRDARFAPEHVVDNQTWEYPAEGKLDYTQGELLTTPHGGYGKGDAVPLAGSARQPMTSWPFYVRPTYWLLPYQKRGWVQLELPEEAPVRLVRVLNTSNAGTNDYAAMQYRVELLDTSGKLVAKQNGEFGKALDRPFQQAFKIPEAFRQYGPTFRGMLEPGIKVPFGDGWQVIEFAERPRARFVKFYIDSYWALGGGLNEIQVY